MILRGIGWEGDFGGECPMEGEGTVDGRPFYFRARWSSWSLGIAHPGGDPVGLDRPGEAAGWYHEEEWAGGDPFAAGYMTEEESTQCMEKAVALFRSTASAGEKC